MNATLEKLAAHESEHKARAVAAYRELVRRSEGDADVEPAEAMQILNDAGKTPSDLKEAIGLIRQRREWAQQASKLKDAEAALAALDCEQEAAHKKLVAAQEEFKAYRASFIARQPVLLSQHADAVRAIDGLQRTADDPAILAIERQMAEKHESLAVAERGLRATLSDRKKHFAGLRVGLNKVKRTAKNWLRVPGVSGPAADAKAMEEEVAAFDHNALKPLEKQLATIDQQRAALNRKSAEVAAAKLVP